MPSLSARTFRALTLVLSLAITFAVAAQSDVDIEKFTNGQDADAAPGPGVPIGSTVSWTYVVSNTGSRPLTNISVTDDQGVTVTCPDTTLDAGLSFTCTASGTAIAGQYANIGTVTGTLPDTSTVTDSDPSHYFGQAAFSVTIEKRTNGIDADTPPGPSVLVGSTVNWEYEITNIGAEALENIVVTDDQGVTVSCPATTLAIGASMICTASGVAQVGQYANIGTVTATLAVSQTPVVDSDASHYFGLSQPFDFGDAPDPTYPSLFSSNGARHLLGSLVFLGNCVDGEGDALTSAAANGDDLATTTPFGNCVTAGDDEDGVTFTTSLAAGQTASIDVVASAPCTLSAWIDYSGDGDWGESDENLFPGGSALIAGTNSLNFTVPATATPGSTFARFRCTTDGEVEFTGAANDGEVEDYSVLIVPPVVSATKTAVLFSDADGDNRADPGDTLRYTITVTNTGAGDAFGVLFTDTPDVNTALVNGSVTTSAGAVTSGNTPGDTTVGVNIGTLIAGGTAVIVFDVTIDDPLPAGVTQVVNSGTVTGSNFAPVNTDDPSLPGNADATAFPVEAEAPAAAVAIPTVGTWAMLVLSALLGMLALRRIGIG